MKPRRSGALAALILQTLREQLSSRAYQLLLVFGGTLIYAALLLGVMAVDQETRVLLDFGLALIELFSLAAAVYAASTILLLEMENKTIYLILTRPVSKGDYLLGRFLGLLAATGLAMIAMSLLHVGLLLFEGWSFTPVYFLLLAGSFFKIALMAALALLLALFSTSVTTAMSITAVLWALGHFTPEVKFLIQKLSGPEGWAMKALLYLLPNLQLFNLQDRWQAPGALGAQPLVTAAAYAFVYAAVCLGLAQLLFRRREF